MADSSDEKQGDAASTADADGETDDAADSAGGAGEIAEAGAATGTDAVSAGSSSLPAISDDADEAAPKPSAVAAAQASSSQSDLSPTPQRAASKTVISDETVDDLRLGEAGWWFSNGVVHVV